MTFGKRKTLHPPPSTLLSAAGLPAGLPAAGRLPGHERSARSLPWRHAGAWPRRPADLERRRRPGQSANRSGAGPAGDTHDDQPGRAGQRRVRPHRHCPVRVTEHGGRDPVRAVALRLQHRSHRAHCPAGWHSPSARSRRPCHTGVLRISAGGARPARRDPAAARDVGRWLEILLQHPQSPGPEHTPPLRGSSRGPQWYGRHPCRHRPDRPGTARRECSPPHDGHPTRPACCSTRAGDHFGFADRHTACSAGSSSRVRCPTTGASCRFGCAGCAGWPCVCAACSPTRAAADDALTG
jgi:hypothetical protein